MMLSDWARKPHAARVRLALAVAAHSDPVLGEWPQLGPVSPCGICTVLPQRHRIVDAMAEHMEVGETAEEVAAEFGVPVEAVGAVEQWMTRWPGAWK
jgi:hypothetical protein